MIKKLIGVLLALAGLAMGLNVCYQHMEVRRLQEIVQGEHERLHELVPATLDTSGDSESLVRLLDSDFMRALAVSDPRRHQEIQWRVKSIRNDEGHVRQYELARGLSALISLAALIGSFFLLRKRSQRVARRMPATS